MNQNTIEIEMHNLEEKIEYKFSDITWLAKAMCAEKRNDIEGAGKNSCEYKNDTLAIVGDALLDTVIADYLFCDKKGITKGRLTDVKKMLVNNCILNEVMEQENLIDFAYNDKHFFKDFNIPENEKVMNSKHNSYLEAIIAAVYYDSNYERMKDWFKCWLLPLLMKYSRGSRF